jgi:serine/threonine protein kinase
VTAGHLEIVTRGIPVVLKRMNRSQNSVAFCQAEVVACQAASSIPYFPTLLSYSHASAASYLVFEAVSSNVSNVKNFVSTTDWYNSGQLPMEQILRTSLHATRGLRRLHSLSWVHNDVKPENLVLWEGGAYLVDMGLAAREGECVSVRGTELFMEPHLVEYQRQHDVAVIDSSRDWYALGLTLVFILAKGDLRAVDQARLITDCVQRGTLGEAEGLRMLLGLLRRQLAAVKASHEQQLQQGGVLQHAEVAAAAGCLLEKMLEVLLLKGGAKEVVQW